MRLLTALTCIQQSQFICTDEPSSTVPTSVPIHLWPYRRICHRLQERCTMLLFGHHRRHPLTDSSWSTPLPRCALGGTCQSVFKLVLQVRLAPQQRYPLGKDSSAARPIHSTRRDDSKPYTRPLTPPDQAIAIPAPSRWHAKV
jgi:hypothetical protein